MRKFAVLSMDVEDWYHLDYFNKDECNQNQSTLDGLDIYLDLLDRYNIKTTFFIVGELVEKLKDGIKIIEERGHEICLHSYAHVRPLQLNLEEFKNDTLAGIKSFKEFTNIDVKGYRAPCFSLDRERLEILRELGFVFDSSKIKFDAHDLYGRIDLNGFQSPNPNIYKQGNFYEFEASTVEILGKNLPVSGGGYLRIFPWMLTKALLKKYFKTNKHYFFYIHPFEFSRNYNIEVPENTDFKTKIRFNKGRKTVENKMHKLIKLLKENNYEFVTFNQIMKNEA
ncbi:polysaccharide deacetylase family protein [Chryseobacterium indologenes]|uniref:Polysaccharide deacetylase n=1 Tax=Chryseobacterium indologenes TaxID=253 RepID=A0A0N0ZU71_CHRID|nr:polysaccharide deacetylase family protein [Chryseobacterium indologenes]KPE49839.1 polysaccharide deacetylase [Chryseobacterium indologenes]